MPHDEAWPPEGMLHAGVQRERTGPAAEEFWQDVSVDLDHTQAIPKITG